MGGTVLEGCPTVYIGNKGGAYPRISCKPNLSQKDKLILCIPDIAKAEAARAEEEKDKKGWLLLEALFYKWFNLERGIPQEQIAPFWIDMNWVLSFPWAKTEYMTFVTFYIMHSNAQEVLYKILLKDNKLTDCREEFDYTTSHFSMWQAYYHSNWAIFIPKIYKVDGLYASLGKFSFRALAKGYTEPTKDGKHKIHVAGISIFVRDSFDFQGSQYLGYWYCETKSYELLGSYSENKITNSVLELFSQQHGYGSSFFIFSTPKEVEYFKPCSYEQ